MKVRYIKETNNGNTLEENLAHWIELQAYCNGINVAKNKTVKCNFNPTLDVPGQSLPNIITDGQISMQNYVSVLLDIQRDRPAEILIDLGADYDINLIITWHGWWLPDRAYFTTLHISPDILNWVEIYNWQTHGLLIETQFGNQFELN